MHNLTSNHWKKWVNSSAMATMIFSIVMLLVLPTQLPDAVQSAAFTPLLALEWVRSVEEFKRLMGASESSGDLLMQLHRGNYIDYLFMCSYALFLTCVNFFLQATAKEKKQTRSIFLSQGGFILLVSLPLIAFACDAFENVILLSLSHHALPFYQKMPIDVSMLTTESFHQSTPFSMELLSFLVRIKFIAFAVYLLMVAWAGQKSLGSVGRALQISSIVNAIVWMTAFFIPKPMLDVGSFSIALSLIFLWVGVRYEGKFKKRIDAEATTKDIAASRLGSRKAI